MLKRFSPLLLIFYFLLLNLPAFGADYDGIWFLGFNLRRPPFDDLKVRQAAAHAIDINGIATGIMSGETGGSFVPPGLTGFDPSLATYKYNLDFARLLLKRAKYAPDDKRLKGLTLLHTDGVKTAAIARAIQSELRGLGARIKLVEVSYRDANKWERELRSGKYNLFLMGYKPDLLTAESAALLEPVFRTGGTANFTGYSSPAVDMMLDQLSVIAPAMTRERELKLREINKTLYRDQPAVVLFYIEKL